MTLSAFSKLAKIKVLQKKIMRTQIDILYKKITQSGVEGTMSLELFFTALEEMANQIFPNEVDNFDSLVNTILENFNDIQS